MAKRIIGSPPKADGYRMPAEFEPQDKQNYQHLVVF